MSLIFEKEKGLKRRHRVLEFIESQDIYGVPVALTYQNKSTF
jgi:hypothetical protein